MRALVVLTLSLAAQPAFADGGNADSVQALRVELERLKAAQAEGAAQIQSLESRIAALETPAAGKGGSNAGAVMPPSGTSTDASSQPLTVTRYEKEQSAGNPPAPAVSQQAVPESRLKLSGDFRLRYEGNYGDNDARTWERGMLRARLGANYAVNDRLAIGGRLATGDPDDPNSSDVTLSNFADDLTISLDQAYAQYRFEGGNVWGGKFATPFARTELVWDSDVNPQGIGADYRLPAGDGALKISALYFLVDNSVAGADSSMIGAQLGYELPVTEALGFELYAGQYDYSLPGVAGADSGDFRTNLIGPDGKYLSDFDLTDVIVSMTYRGWERWPLRVVGEYVRNGGARTPADSGYNVELSTGQVSGRGDWRFGYGYSVAEVDAVLAAFSQDNTTIGTNYRQHALFVDYALTDKILVNGTLYHYRPYDAEFSGVNDPDDWLDRLRVNFQIGF